MQGVSIRNSGTGLLARLSIHRETGGRVAEDQALGNLGMARGVQRFEDAITTRQDTPLPGSSNVARCRP